MSQSISTNAVIVTQQTLAVMLVRYPIIATLARSFDAIPGIGVKVPLISATEAGEWNSTDGYAATDRTVDSVEVQPSDWKIRHHTYKINPIEAASTNPQIINRLSESGAHALGRAILDNIVALFTAANVTNSTEATSGVKFDTIVAADGALAARGTPDPKFALLNGTAFAELLSDDTVHNALVRGDATKPVVSGNIGDLIGIPVGRYAGMADNDERLKGIVGGVDGVALVTGVPIEEPSGGVALNIVEEANSGLRVLLREYVEQKSGIHYRTVAVGIATKLGQTDALQRIVAPAPVGP